MNISLFHRCIAWIKRRAPALAALPRRAVAFVILLVLLPAAAASGRTQALLAAVDVSPVPPSPSPSAAASTTPLVTASPTSPSASPTPDISPSPAPVFTSAPPAALQATVRSPSPSPSPSPSTKPTPRPAPSKGKPAARPTAGTPKPKPTSKPTPRPTPTPANPLLLRVYKGSQRVVALRVQNGQETAVRVMICSTGRTAGMTPNGAFKITAKYTYRQLQGAMGQYCSRFNGSILFHSVPIDNAAKKAAVGKSRMKISEYSKLGTMASDGCVRLLVRDALWIYSNCPIGTKVEVVSSTSPFGGGSRPELKTGPPYTSADGHYGWDPTDPDPQNPYRRAHSTEQPAPTQPPVTATPTAAPQPSPQTSAPTPSPTPTVTSTPSPTASPTEVTTEEPGQELFCHE